VYSILLVGLGTFFIGLLPTYEDAGIWAPVLLVACRIIQSVSMGRNTPASANHSAAQASKSSVLPNWRRPSGTRIR
jgi:MFS family permease